MGTHSALQSARTAALQRLAEEEGTTLTVDKLNLLQYTMYADVYKGHQERVYMKGAV